VFEVGLRCRGPVAGGQQQRPQRAYGELVVWLRDGLYPLAATVQLGPAESGSATAPVVWRGYPGERARVA